MPAEFYHINYRNKRHISWPKQPRFEDEKVCVFSIIILIVAGLNTAIAGIAALVEIDITTANVIAITPMYIFLIEKHRCQHNHFLRCVDYIAKYGE